MLFNDYLRSLRKDKKMTQDDVAEILGIERSTYTKYESGTSRPNSEMLKKLSQLFDVSINDLLDSHENEIPSNVKILLRDARKLTPVQLDAIHRLVKIFVNEKK